MIRSLVFISTLAFVFGYKNKSPDTPTTFVNVADTIPMPVFTMKDSLGLPDRYKANVVTPVCESDKCYIIEIDFYWDLIGRFVSYDTIPCTSHNDFINPCPKFGTNRIVALNGF